MTELRLIELEPMPGRHLLVVDGATIGRQGDLTIDDAEASRRHASLAVGGEAVTVTDLGSSNGTYVNGARIEAPVALGPGDRLRIGRHEWHLMPVAAQAAPAAVAGAGGRGDVPAPPDPSASRVRQAPPLQAAAPPAFAAQAGAAPSRPARRGGSEATMGAATAICFGVVAVDAIVLIAYFASR